jgi:hypothetical protein
VLGSACLPALLQIAIAAAGLRERGPATHALAFLAHLLSAWERLLDPEQQAGEQEERQQQAQQAQQAQACLGAEGERLVEVLLLGALDTCPRQHLRQLSGCLHTMLCSGVYRAAAAQWLQRALQRTDLPGEPWAWEACSPLPRCKGRAT